ncbi:NTP transferase domain-containing protein [Domibacillus indicus]|uniref:NTP transferase domain-containing protein n=1 Tax=Domibacillus indicus TaxID=1437523 RepID=UPI000698F876|nr:NTP transferase domain-containing protein [Domibacillus indicus]
MNSPIIGILLAAGSSRRMGENKLLLPLGDTTIGGATLRAALSSRLDHVVVVRKKEEEACWIQPDFLRERNWSQTVCKDASRGQAYSLAAGLKAAENAGAGAAVILLADQPFVNSSLINELIDMYNARKPAFVSSRFHDIARPPVLFSRHLFAELQKLEGDRGAGNLLKQPSFACRGIMIERKRDYSFFDIDTKKDYKEAVRRERNGGCVNGDINICLAAGEPGRGPGIKKRA